MNEWMIRDRKEMFHRNKWTKIKSMVTEAWKHGPYYYLPLGNSCAESLQKVLQMRNRFHFVKINMFQRHGTINQHIYHFLFLLVAHILTDVHESSIYEIALLAKCLSPRALFCLFCPERTHRFPGWGIVQMTREAIATIANFEFLHKEKKSGSYSHPADKHSKQLIFGDWTSISLIKTTTHPT